MDAPGLFARTFPSLDRAVQVGVVGGKVIGVSFPADPPEDADPDHPLLDRIEAYLGGEPDDFDDVEVGLTVPTEQRRVLESVRSIPYGRRLSIERIARMSGLDAESEDDLATVERALRENPVPLFVPDHRVDGPGATPGSIARALRRLED